jgi:hypothetical protein
MRRHTTKDIQLYDYGIDCWTPARDTEELENKIIETNKVLTAALAHVTAIKEAEKLIGGHHSFTTDSLTELIREIQQSLNNNYDSPVPNKMADKGENKK